MFSGATRRLGGADRSDPRRLLSGLGPLERPLDRHGAAGYSERRRRRVFSDGSATAEGSAGVSQYGHTCQRASSGALQFEHACFSFVVQIGHTR